MADIFARLNGGEFLGLCGILLALVAVLGGISVAITKVVVAHRRRTLLDEMEATLKMEMIHRGMSAGEIKQVLESRMGDSRSNPFVEMWANWLGATRGADGNCPPVKMANFFEKAFEKR